jgi:hypothetical protein
MLDGGSEHHNDKRASGETWGFTFIYAYLTGLGEFNTDDFEDTGIEGYFYFFFLMCTLMI